MAKTQGFLKVGSMKLAAPVDVTRVAHRTVWVPVGGAEILPRYGEVSSNLVPGRIRDQFHAGQLVSAGCPQ